MSIESTESSDDLQREEWVPQSYTPLWNGREVVQRDKEEIAFPIIYPQEHTDLKNRIITQITTEETFEDFLEAHDFEFDDELAEVETCKSFGRHCRRIYKETKKGFKKTEKGIKKTAKLVEHAGKKAFHGTVDFVKEHKNEILIATGIALGAAGLGLGIAALVKSREETDLPTDPPIPVPLPEPVILAAAAAEITTTALPDTSIHFGTHLPPFPTLQNTEAKIQFTEPEKKLFFDFKQKQFAYNPQLNVWEGPSTPNSISSTLHAIKSGLESIGRGINEMEFAKAPSYETSRCYEKHGTSPPGLLFTYINGMNNPMEEAVANAEHLRSFTHGLKVHGIYNKSNTVLGDVAEIFGCNYFGHSPITEDLLIKTWTDFFAENPFAICVHTCHSQGALHTKNALEKLPKALREQIIVIAIAPAVVVPKNLCMESHNYASKNDIVHLGQNFTSIFGSACHNDPDIQLEIIRHLMDEKKELIILEPDKNAIGMDHSFMSPTFIELIKQNIDDIVEKYGSTQ